MDRATIEPAIRAVLSEISTKLNDAARKSRGNCALAGSIAEGVTVFDGYRTDDL